MINYFHVWSFLKAMKRVLKEKEEKKGQGR